MPPSLAEWIRMVQYMKWFEPQEKHKKREWHIA